jgi:hypothetical protein
MIAAHMAKKLFGHDEADATWRPTSAWIVLIILQIETIVECDFFLGQDVAGGDNPNALRFRFCVAIRRATITTAP